MTMMRVADEINNAIIKNRRLRVAIVKGYWDKIVGKVFQKSEPLYEKDKVLFVMVEDTMYAHHMVMNKKFYIENINKFLNGNYIEDLRFKVGNILKSENISIADKKNDLINGEFEKHERRIDEKLSIDEKIDILKEYSRKKEIRLLKSGYKHCSKCGTFFLGEGDICIVCLNLETKKKRNTDI